MSSNIPDDASSMSDDVFEDPETTQRRVDENRRRNDYANTDYNLTRDHAFGLPSGSAAGPSYRSASPSGYAGYMPANEAIKRYGLAVGGGGGGVGGGVGGGCGGVLPHSGHHANNNDADEDDDLAQLDDDWRSYRYDEVGMHQLPQQQHQPQQHQPFDDTVNHKTILLGDSGVGKTSFLVKYNTGEFRLGSFSATVGIALTVVIVGDSGVGKTCFLIRYRDGRFMPRYFDTTIGIDFRNKVVVVDGTRVKLQIWDTAGQERFRSVTHAYYRDAHALLLLYDVTNKTTYDNIRAWLGEIREYAQDDVVIVLIGNKADSSSSERQVKREDGERLAREHNVPFMETSAKTGWNVELAFTAVARQLKFRGNGNGDDGKFNVHDFVRDNTRARTICAQCKSM